MRVRDDERWEMRDELEEEKEEEEEVVDLVRQTARLPLRIYFASSSQTQAGRGCFSDDMQHRSSLSNPLPSTVKYMSDIPQTSGKKKKEKEKESEKESQAVSHGNGRAGLVRMR